jgi:hypothetical protein
MKDIYQTKNKRNKKAQLTIFIILAIILLFSFALYFYLKAGATHVKPPVEQPEVAQEVKPIQLFVLDCVREVGKDALIKMGNNGGYIELKNLKISPVPYDSDVLVFDPQKLPYWYYLKDDCNNPQSPLGCLQTKRPPMCNSGSPCVVDATGANSIEEQLNDYVDAHLNDCLQDFKDFKQQFDIQSGKINVETTVREDGVSFKANYPLDITVRSSNKKVTIPFFYAEHNIKLKDIYNLASDVFDAESKYQFLETSTLNIIAAYSGLSPDLLPPTSGVELFTAGKKYWTRSDVKTKLMNDILPYLNFLQIVNAGNAQSISETGTSEKYLRFSDGFYKSMAIKVSNQSYFDLDANIVYPYSDIYFRIGDSEIIKPDSFDAGGNPFMKMIGFFMNNYNFKYDLTYPVIVRIRDPEAFDGEGYTFSFAMEANIRKNIPVNGSIIIVNTGGLREIDLESQNQQVNRTITIETNDKHTGEALAGVFIYYRCGNQYTMGETALESVNGEDHAILERQFPYCPVGGEIIYEKPGYMGSGIDFNNNEGNDPKSFSFELWPLREKNITVYKRTPANIDLVRRTGAGAIALYSTAITPISNNESVMISLMRKKNDSRESDVPVVGFMIYKSQNTSNITNPSLNVEEQRKQVLQLYADHKINATDRDSMLHDLESVKDIPAEQTDVETQTEQYTFEVVPGTYALDAFMVYNGNVHIPAETRTICPGPEILGICVAGEKTIDLPEQSFDSWINGGAKVDFTLSENNVYSDKSNLIFYVLESPIPTTWSELEKYQVPEQYQQGKTFMLKPRLE